MSLSDLYDDIAADGDAWLLDETSGTRYSLFGRNDLVQSASPGYAAGLFSNAMDCEAGSTQYVYKAYSGAPLDPGDVDFAVGLWVKPESLPAYEMAIGAGYYNWSIWLVGGVPWFYFNTNPGLGLNSGVSALSTGAWHFIAIKHDSVNNLVGISVDGGNWVTASQVGLNSGGSQDFTIGCSHGGGYPFDGLIDEAWISVGYLPTNADLAAIWASGAGVSIEDWSSAGGGSGNPFYYYAQQQAAAQ